MDDYEDSAVAGGPDEPKEKGYGAAPDGVGPDTVALAEQWCAKVAESKKHFAKDFKRMRDCAKLARNGADDNWIAAGKYVVPIINRHVNQAVAALYAKNPKPVVKRKQKLLATVWDGRADTAMAAGERMMTGMPMPEDMTIVQEIMAIQAEVRRMDRMARTLELVDQHYMSEQAKNYKAQLKMLVRRVKTRGAGYVKLGFQRELGRRGDPDIDAQIMDVRSKLDRIEQIMAKGEQGNLTEQSPEVAELRTLLADLEARDTIVVREGPVLSFLKSDQVIVDRKCTHLRTFAHAGWIAIEYDMTPEKVLGFYGVDLKKGDYTEHGSKDEPECKVWHVFDRINQQELVVAEGYKGFLVEPKAPDLYIERFFPVFALVFNETDEDDDDRKGSIIPLSDVWLARHAQYEYNRAREGLRQHRIAARPYHVAAKGMLEESDRHKFGTRDDHELIEVNMPAMDGMDINRVVQRGPTTPIDPNLYDINPMFDDVLRGVGTQQANFGATSGSTATESSIAESSRMSTVDDNIDDLDEFLSELARARGQVYLTELSKETVVEIVGPGAVWPDVPATREQAAKELELEIKAGSSGRPNLAAELANLERAMPFLLQLPDVDPKVLRDKYFTLLDIEPDDSVAAGLPSIQALNAMMAKMAMGAGAGAAPTGDPASDPGAQGTSGQMNAPSTDVRPGGPQPAFPAPGEATVQ